MPLPRAIVCLAGLWLNLLAGHLSASDGLHVTTRSLSAPLAARLALGIYETCSAEGYHVAVAVVTRDGRLLAFLRSPLAGPHTIEVSQSKAYTAASFKAATSQLMDRPFMRDIPGVLLIGGGLPITVGGHFYGAIGVSGAPADKAPGDRDEACAKAGLQAIAKELELGG